MELWYGFCNTFDKCNTNSINLCVYYMNTKFSLSIFCDNKIAIDKLSYNHLENVELIANTGVTKITLFLLLIPSTNFKDFKIFGVNMY